MCTCAFCEYVSTHICISVCAHQSYEGIAAPKDPFGGNIVFLSKGEKEEGRTRREMREGVDFKASGPLRDYCLIALRLSNLTSVV